MSYEAFVLTEASRAKLARMFPPQFPKFIGHHVTYRFGVRPTDNVPYGQQTTGWFDVVGYSVDDGIEVLVVEVAGKLTRPDGKVYHITWSIDPAKGRSPKHSSNVIATQGWVRYTDGIDRRFDATFDFLYS